MSSSFCDKENWAFIKTFYFTWKFGARNQCVSRLLVILLDYGNFKLENTLEFIKVNNKVINIEEGYFAFRVDCNDTLCKQRDTNSSIKNFVKSKFCK